MVSFCVWVDAWRHRRLQPMLRCTQSMAFGLTLHTFWGLDERSGSQCDEPYIYPRGYVVSYPLGYAILVDPDVNGAAKTVRVKGPCSSVTTPTFTPRGIPRTPRQGKHAIRHSRHWCSVRNVRRRRRVVIAIPPSVLFNIETLASLEQVIAGIHALDMDDVRAKIAESQPASAFS